MHKHAQARVYEVEKGKDFKGRSSKNAICWLVGEHNVAETIHSNGLASKRLEKRSFEPL